jgi:arginyl-tRNA synthetase
MANAVAQSIGSEENTPIDKIELKEAGPNCYLNIYLKNEFLEQEVMRVLKMDQVRVEDEEQKQPKRVLVDFSSPNIAKNMHVGHLRSTIQGDAISRVLEFMGYDVLRTNHLGDWGTQFGMLIA